MVCFARDARVSRVRAAPRLRGLAPLQHHGAPRVRRVFFALRDFRAPRFVVRGDGRRLEPNHGSADAVLILQVIVQRQRRDIRLVPVPVWGTFWGVVLAVPTEAVPGVARAHVSSRLVVILQPHVGGVAGVRRRGVTRRARRPVPRARVEPRVHLVHDEVVVHVAVYAVVVRVLLLERSRRERAPGPANSASRVMSSAFAAAAASRGAGAVRLEEQLEVVVVLGERDGVQRRR